MNSRIGLFGVLLCLGLGWGLTQPLTKIAVSTGHEHFGLIFWQFSISATLMFTINLFRGGKLPLTRKHLLLFAFIAAAGTLIPNSFSYIAIRHIPAGVQSIIISLMPMFALPMALIIGAEKFDLRRLLGVVLGAVAIILLIGPEAGVSTSLSIGFVLLAALAPFFYALESIYLGRYGSLDLDPVQLLLGGTALGAIVTAPLALYSGQWVTPALGPAELALMASSVLHALSYAGFFWLVGRAGPIFAAQSGYLVTACGVLWSMLVLGERYSGWIWLALVVMLVGLFLVQPRGNKKA